MPSLIDTLQVLSDIGCVIATETHWRHPVLVSVAWIWYECVRTDWGNRRTEKPHTVVCVIENAPLQSPKRGPNLRTLENSPPERSTEFCSKICKGLRSLAKMMMIGADPDRGALTPRSDLSDSSDIVGTPGVIPFIWEEEPGRPKGPGEHIFEAVLSRESLQGSTSTWQREIVEHTPSDDLETSGSDESSPESHIMKLNLRASLMGVHILDDETEMFFSRQVSNASSNMHNFQSAGAVPFTWEIEPGRPLQPNTRPEPSVGLTPPPGSRPVSGILYPGQFGNGATSGLLCHGPAPSGSRPLSGALQLDLGPEAQYAGGGMHFSEKLFKKLVGQTRTAPNRSSVMQYDGVTISKSKRRGEGSSETLDRHFGHYSSDMRYNQDNDSASPTSTLDHHETTESSPSTESERFYPSRNPNITRYLDASTPPGRFPPQEASIPVGRPSSQLAQCLLSLTAMADDTTDEDDIIFEQPSTTSPLWMTLPEQPPVEPHLDWSIVQYQAPPSKPQHRNPKSSSNPPKTRRTVERWSSNSSSWNLSLLAKPKATVTKVPVSGSSSKPKRHSKRHSSGMANGVTLREIHNGASSSTVLTYDRSGDAHGRHKWERDSSSSLPSVEEICFEAYDRPGEVINYLCMLQFLFSELQQSHHGTLFSFYDPCYGSI